MNKTRHFDFPTSFDLACPGGEPPKDESTTLMMRVLTALGPKRWTAREAWVRKGDKTVCDFRTHHDLIVTPHISGLTVESQRKAMAFAAGEIARFFRIRGGSP